MTVEELKALKSDKVVDARGTACPGPLLAAKKAIGDIQAGQVMEILSADEGTKSDIPKWAKKQSFEYLGSIDEDGMFRLFLKK
ncbi:sulfurtransferase TusA family protein [Microbacter margulisiae]|uniref:TusA-related sulfurtransferase n=1 Tax=Microbacter margulisiae TaxID=1350067 RepID=A0A7W5DSW3_9PORP|nr:sulfurtransferase TusA family protein [Microbacter margulisiae]MBB3187633.1 TusA-related sulfurtransferase [Microbacter margulisiae]